LGGGHQNLQGIPLILKGDFGKTVVGLGEALFDVSDGWRVFLGGFLALALVAVALRFLLLQLLQLLEVADASEVENLKGSGKVVVFFLVFVSLLGLLVETMGN
jgi:hypothetical protein